MDEMRVGEKDQFGRMPFTIIGENTLGRTIVQEDIEYHSDQVPQEGFYWVVYNLFIDMKYWP